jgi:hypothetical protein
MSLYWSILLFNLKLSSCVSNFPFQLVPFSIEEKREICIAWILEKERNGSK